MPVDASWDDLRVLLAVARTGSLSRAAADLDLTQPTVGRRLDRLEEIVGVPLVRRTGRGCTLSERGTAMLPLIERMQEAVDGVAQIATSAHNDLVGVVRLATGELPARFIARRLPSILRGAPQLRLEILSGVDYVSLERGDADLALRTAAPAGDAWVAHPLGPVDFAVFAAPSFIETHPYALDVDGFKRCPWVGYPRDAKAPSARWLHRLLDRDVDIAFSSSVLILEAASCGAGLAVLPQSIGDDEPRLRRLPIPVDGLRFDSYLVVHPSARRLKRVRWVASRLREQFG